MSTDNQTPVAMAPTILVVDDDPKIVRLVRSYLESASYIVESTGDGSRALQAIRSLRPDAVVLDLMLPGMDGLAVTQTVRADPELRTTPILLLTARVEDVDRILGLELGADDYVTKPFNPREVVARVKALLRRTQMTTQPQTQALLHVRDITLDTGSHTVHKGTEIVTLTPSEFDILQLFLRSPGQALTRTQIIEQGLGYEYAGLERTVDSHIKNLRRKLEDDPRKPTLLETVFGVGYRLNP